MNHASVLMVNRFQFHLIQNNLLHDLIMVGVIKRITMSSLPAFEAYLHSMLLLICISSGVNHTNVFVGIYTHVLAVGVENNGYIRT